MAATCRSAGRPSPRPASASGSRRCPPGMTGALPSPPGRCHRASRIGVCTFCDHQVLAGLTGLAGCRQAAGACSPGPGRISAPHRRNGGAGWAFSPPAGGHGPSGRGIVVPFQLRPAGRGVAAGRTAGVTAASQCGAAGSAVAGHRGPGDARVPVPRHYRAGGPEGVGLLAPGAGQPAEGIDAPAGADRAGPGVGLAERCRIGMPGDARAHLAPHDRYPQLITDHSPHRNPGTGSSLGLHAGGGLGAGRGPRPGSGQRPEPRLGPPRGRGPRQGHRPERGLPTRDRQRWPLRRGHCRAARLRHRLADRRASRPSGASRCPAACWRALAGS